MSLVIVITKLFIYYLFWQDSRNSIDNIVEQCHLGLQQVSRFLKYKAILEWWLPNPVNMMISTSSQ